MSVETMTAEELAKQIRFSTHMGCKTFDDALDEVERRVSYADALRAAAGEAADYLQNGWLGESDNLAVEKLITRLRGSDTTGGTK